MPACPDNVHAVVLAAGASTRLGRPKQLLRWQGRTLLERTLENADALLPGRVCIVLGAEAETIREAVTLDDVTIAYNPDWNEGIAASIRTGMKALPESAKAVLMLLCDQPLIEKAHLQALFDAWRDDPTRIAASYYHQTPGVPALFPAAYFDELKALRGDRGAKSLLLHHRPRLVPVNGQAALDIDSIDDYNLLRRQQDAGE